MFIFSGLGTPGCYNLKKQRKLLSFVHKLGILWGLRPWLGLKCTNGLGILSWVSSHWGARILDFLQ
jgi:hypothetical protein